MEPIREIDGVGDTIDPENIPEVTIGKRQFEVEVVEEFPTESGTVGYRCQLVNVKAWILYENCTLTYSRFASIDGEVSNQAPNRHAWLLDAKNNSGKRKGKFALIGGEWRSVHQ